MDFKKEAAAKAVTLIGNNMLAGLGAGATIAYLIEFLKQETNNGLQIKCVTSSFSTRQLLLKNNFTVLPSASLSKIDIYFDGCDQLDKNLNALKSGGGIHTHEKLLASMSDQFILLGDETKLADYFDGRFPVVIEILPDAAVFAPYKIQHLFPASKSAYRMSDKKEGYVVTDNGNYLLELWFEEWPDLATINPVLKSVTGVIETSLFYKMAHKAVIAGADGIKILDRF